MARLFHPVLTVPFFERILRAVRRPWLVRYKEDGIVPCRTAPSASGAVTSHQFKPLKGGCVRHAQKQHITP